MLHLAVIPARGGSQGVARKNLQLVGGLPLVARTVRVAISSDVFAAVVVSTDDDEIAEVSTAYGATLVKRPAELAQDTSPTEPVMQHALTEAEAALGLTFGGVWLLQPTSPFLWPEDIARARTLLEGGDCDAVVSVERDHSFFWSDSGTEGLVNPSYDPAKRPRRQDLAPFFRENGALYAVKRALWDESQVRVAGRAAPLVMPAWRSLDIDDESDLEAARALASHLERGRRARKADLGAVRAVALDFDGVMTDDSVLLDEQGVEAVFCSRRDGLGVAMLRAAGVHLAVFSTEKNPVVGQRCRKLSIECFQDLSDKKAAVQKWLAELDVTPDQMVFLGNDVNDLECLRLAGVAVVPADAHGEALRLADVVLASRGGEGAVRELADLILESR